MKPKRAEQSSPSTSRTPSRGSRRPGRTEARDLRGSGGARSRSRTRTDAGPGRRVGRGALPGRRRLRAGDGRGRGRSARSPGGAVALGDLRADGRPGHHGGRLDRPPTRAVVDPHGRRLAPRGLRRQPAQHGSGRGDRGHARAGPRLGHGIERRRRDSCRRWHPDRDVPGRTNRRVRPPRHRPVAGTSPAGLARHRAGRIRTGPSPPAGREPGNRRIVGDDHDRVRRCLGRALAHAQHRTSIFPPPDRHRHRDRPRPPSRATSRRRDARTVWRWLLAIAAVPVPIFVAVFRYLLPYSDGDTPERSSPNWSPPPPTRARSCGSGSRSCCADSPASLAVAWLTRRRTPVLTTIAMILAVPGYIALFAGGTYGDLLVLRHGHGSRSGLPDGVPARVRDGIQPAVQRSGADLRGRSPVRHDPARHRPVAGRIAPTWLAIGLTVSQPIHLASVMTGIRPLDLVGWGLTAVGFTWAAWRLAKLPNDEFDLPPVTSGGGVR